MEKVKDEGLSERSRKTFEKRCIEQGTRKLKEIACGILFQLCYFQKRIQYATVCQNWVLFIAYTHRPYFVLRYVNNMQSLCSIACHTIAEQGKCSSVKQNGEITHSVPCLWHIFHLDLCMLIIKQAHQSASWPVIWSALCKLASMPHTLYMCIKV